MCVSLQMISTIGFSGTVSLFKNGSVRDAKESPYCNNKQKFSLSSYSLRIKQTCSNLERRCRIQEKPLSPESVMLLHDRCSFKRECDQLNFETEFKEHKNVSFACCGRTLSLFRYVFLSFLLDRNSIHLWTKWHLEYMHFSPYLSSILFNVCVCHK